MWCCRVEASEARIAEAQEAAAISDAMQAQLQERLAAQFQQLEQVWLRWACFCTQTAGLIVLCLLQVSDQHRLAAIQMFAGLTLSCQAVVFSGQRTSVQAPFVVQLFGALS